MDKIAKEIPLILLEHNTFSSILNFIDFFDLNIRKYAVRICLTLSKYVRNNIIFKTNIQPGLLNLTNLTKFCGTGELEKYILDNSINCFYYLLRNIKINKISEANKNIYFELTENGLIINLLDSLVNLVYLLKNDLNNNSAKSNSKQSENYGEIIKKILLVFENLTSKSDIFSNDFLEIEITDKDKKISIFDVINIIIDSEIGGIGKNYENDNDNDSYNFESNKQFKSGCFQNIMNNIFNFLISLYPQDIIKENKDNNSNSNNNEEEISQRIINKFCNDNYNLFNWNYKNKNKNISTEVINNNNINTTQKNEAILKNTKILINQIIPKLLTNFINFSSSSNSSYKLLKFLKIFISNSNKELIQRIINPKLISNIFSSKN